MLKKLTTTAALALAFALAGAGSAHATNWYPYNINTLTTYLDKAGASYEAYVGKALSGLYEITPLAYEAADKIQLRDSFEAGDVLFTNTKVESQRGKWKTVDVTEAVFYDTSLKSKNDRFIDLLDPKRVEVMELTKDWVVNKKLTLSAGTLILGLNDRGSCDKDFDDFILAARGKSAPTPVPGAVWLLGIGLLGLLGFKHARRNPA